MRIIYNVASTWTVCLSYKVKCIPGQCNDAYIIVCINAQSFQVILARGDDASTAGVIGFAAIAL